MRKRVGQYGELLSRKYLINQGYSILASNYRTKLGEIDIIAQKKDVVAFIEVKTRKSLTYGLPREAVTPHKQMTIHRLAQQYIQYKKLEGVTFRFDVIEVQFIEDAMHINHIENAF